jgi:hypothetical protein
VVSRGRGPYRELIPFRISKVRDAVTLIVIQLDVVKRASLVSKIAHTRSDIPYLEHDRRAGWRPAEITPPATNGESDLPRSELRIPVFSFQVGGPQTEHLSVKLDHACPVARIDLHIVNLVPDRFVRCPRSWEFGAHTSLL